MCTLGDPLSDLGALLAYWRDPSDPDWLQAISTMPSGFPSRVEMVEWYGEKSGRSVADINFYHVLGLFRVVVIIAQIYIRYQRGQTQDKRFAAFGAMVPLMAKKARVLSES
jgi:aminoglycoside phosphotransferase (APT) family kinase protein